MATTANTTALEIKKDQPQAHTLASGSFNRLLARFETFVAHEQRLDAPGIDVMSATFKKDLTDAERAREALCEAVGETLIAPNYRPEDRALRRLAHVLFVMLTCEDDDDRQHFYESTLRHRDIFGIEGLSPAALSTQRLSKSFFSHFDDLARLREFGGEGPLNFLEPDVAPVPA